MFELGVCHTYIITFLPKVSTLLAGCMFSVPGSTIPLSLATAKRLIECCLDLGIRCERTPHGLVSTDDWKQVSTVTLYLLVNCFSFLTYVQVREDYLQGTGTDTLITVEKWIQKCGAYHAELDEMNWSWWQLLGII